MVKVNAVIIETIQDFLAKLDDRQVFSQVVKDRCSLSA